jgi:SAM-dependent methyltransferase
VGRRFEPVWAHQYDLVMTSHIPNEKSDYYSDETGEKYFAWQNRFGSRSGIINARKFKEFIFPEDSVLDFGCGGGYLLQALDAKVKIGIEVNPDAVEDARKKGIVLFENLVPVEDNSIDKVISNHALEHVYNPVYELSEMFRVLKPGGFLLLCVPIDEYRNQKVFLKNEINNHLQTWTPQLLGNSFVEAGFKYEGITIKVMKHSWFPGTKYFWKNEALFNFLCQLYAFITKSGKQIVIKAQK